MSKLMQSLSRLKLADKRPKLVELFPDDPQPRAKGIIRAQMRLLHIIAKQTQQGHPARVIVLKARQLGISTFVDLMQLNNVMHLPNRQAFVCAHTADSSDSLFQRVKTAHEHAQDERKMESSSKRQISWRAPHSSRYLVKTAGVVHLKRGSTFHHVHCSELAFWTRQQQTLLSVTQCVPNEVSTSIVIESTANGAGDIFHEKWQASRSYYDALETGDWSGYIGLFLSWLDNPEEYSLPIPDGYDWEAVPAEYKEDEPRLLELGATPEQLYWRRRKIYNDCEGRVDSFRQEYPAWPEQAFLLSGRRAIPASITRQHRATVLPSDSATMRQEQDGRTKLIYDEYAPTPCWQIWKEPEQGADYTIGGDVASGKPSSNSDEWSDPDYSTIVVLKRATLETVAVWRGRIPTDAFGEEMLKAARYYNHAWVSPEANSHGIAVLNVLRAAKYHRIYNREEPDQSEVIGETNMLGWLTTGGANGTRAGMIDTWIACCRKRAEEFGLNTTITCYSEDLAEEEERFIYTKTGKREHRPNCHDDVLFAAMIALQLHIRCPRTYDPLFVPWQQTNITEDEIRFAGGRDLGAIRMAEQRSQADTPFTRLN